MPNKIKTYEVKKIERPIQISGEGTDSIWQTATLLEDFIYPWRAEKAPQTTFRALWSDTDLYFLFWASDPEIKSKKIDLQERKTLYSDRVEIFFKAHDETAPYYSLEMDALGRILDSEGKFNEYIDLDWNWPDGHILVKAAIKDEGYWVEGKITFESLGRLKLYENDNILRAGLYRGEYEKDVNNKIKPKWISWVSPDSPVPNFHIPSSFGLLKLLD